MYFYIKNLQGDVMHIATADNTIVASYTYDAWGNIESVTGTLADTVGTINPIRYRGYYYDNETGLYYLNSRYYDSEIGRFINADSYVSTGQGILGNNMFAYCGNNPVYRTDPSGQFFGIVFGISVLVGTMVSLTSCSAEPEPTPVPDPEHEPYQTADGAARAFSEQVYSSSSYIRHEYGTEIYSRTIAGITTYNYNPPTSGSPHQVILSGSTPEGTDLVALAHTHPNSISFSDEDKDSARKLRINIYMVGPNLELQRYNYKTKDVTGLGAISPIALTSNQQFSLIEEFHISWKAHISGQCDFRCKNKKWPATP